MTRSMSASPQTAADERANQGPAKPAFEEPRLAFIEPKLTPHGDLRDSTAGFYGSCDPSKPDPNNPNCFPK